MDDMEEQYGVAPLGRYSAWATPSGTEATVIDSTTEKAVRSFTGETAWSDAERYAGDLNAQPGNRDPYRVI